jgi:hypothetical protein
MQRVTTARLCSIWLLVSACRGVLGIREASLQSDAGERPPNPRCELPTCDAGAPDVLKPLLPQAGDRGGGAGAGAGGRGPEYQCSNAAVRCVGSNTVEREQCVAGQWRNYTACPAGFACDPSAPSACKSQDVACAEGACGTGGGAPQDSGGTAGGGTAGGGTAGSGATAGDDGASGSAGTSPDAVCKDGDLKCAGAAQRLALRCMSGQWVQSIACNDGENCDNRPGTTLGTCLPVVPECAGNMPDALVCVGADVHRCGPDLVNVSVTSCSGDTPACRDGRCVECNAPAPAQLCMDAYTARSCSSMGTWVSKPPCGATLPNCLNGTCVELCVSGQKRCSNGVPQSCLDQTWQSGGACSAALPVCSDGQCVECKDPTPDLLCSGLVPRACVANMWSDGAPCAGMHATSTCAMGQCKTVSCALGWDDCNGLPNDGCEHEVSADPHNCGQCNNECSSGLCSSNRCLVLHTYGFAMGTMDDPAAANTLFGVSVHIAGDGVLTRLGFITTQVLQGPDQHLYMALYESGSDGEPTNLVQATPQLTIAKGINESAVTQTSITSGNYWILWVSDSTAYFATNGGSVNLRTSSYTYGALPASIRGALGIAAGPPPDLYAVVAQ